MTRARFLIIVPVTDRKALGEQGAAGAMAETTLNLRGLKCPLPALKTRKALTRLAGGDRLVVECTDPLSTIDIPNLLNQTGDILEGNSASAETGLYVFRIRKAGPNG